MKIRWFGICWLLLTRIPLAVSAQSLPSVLPGTSDVTLTSPITSDQLNANENGNGTNLFSVEPGLAPGRLTVLPEHGRTLYFQAIDAAKNQIRIEICVLEDPQILQHIQAALSRGVKVHAIVDSGKYLALESEQQNLALYLTSAGGQLHLSNPIFPRSFPKIILVDSSLLVYGSACLDETTFIQYRDFATASIRAHSWFSFASIRGRYSGRDRVPQIPAGLRHDSRLTIDPIVNLGLSKTIRSFER